MSTLIGADGILTATPYDRARGSRLTMSTATLKLYASLAERLPSDAQDNAVRVELVERATIGSVLAGLDVPEALCHLVLLNGSFVPPGERHTTALADGDVVTVWPPVSGG